MGKLIACLSMAMMLLLAFSLPGEAGTKDFRGVWVATVYSLDYPATATTSSEALKSEADSILDQSKAMGLNAVILQVRPSADALYPSTIYPWSKYLTGKQGREPDKDFDPLAYWVAGAHSRGLQLHAWINPYRVAMSTADYQSLAATNPAKLHPQWVYEVNDRYYFDAGIPAVRQMIVNGVTEILNNYAVDGIHLDDYFYPGAGGTYDDATFTAYPNGFTDKDNWRRHNNDLLIKALYDTTKAKGRTFGVSPAGIWANKSSLAAGSDTAGNQTYFSAYADTRKWVKEGWLDYICPQIYWPIGYKIADYEILAHWWAQVAKDTGVNLYIGMADYRYLNTDSTKWADISIIQNQMALNTSIPQITGEVHFRYGSLIGDGRLKKLYTEAYAPYLNPPALLKAHKAYIHGDGGYFRPEMNLTRGELAVIFAQLMVDAEDNPLWHTDVSYPTVFKDVKPGDWYANAIGFMQSKGILAGYSDGTFCPKANVTRAECAMVISYFFQTYPGMDNNFSDVPNNHWAKTAIANCYAKGFVSGYPSGVFCPNNPIKRAEVVSMVNRLLGRTDAKDTFGQEKVASPFVDIWQEYWAYYEILEAAISH